MRTGRPRAMSFMPCMFILNELAHCDEPSSEVCVIAPAQQLGSTLTVLPAQSASMSG
jgi:hypothetical protein